VVSNQPVDQYNAVYSKHQSTALYCVVMPTHTARHVNFFAIWDTRLKAAKIVSVPKMGGVVSNLSASKCVAAKWNMCIMAKQSVRTRTSLAQSVPMNATQAFNW
jgi:hypothetical protein